MADLKLLWCMCYAGAAKMGLTTGPVLDWCLEYGDHPAVWIITSAAW